MASKLSLNIFPSLSTVDKKYIVLREDKSQSFIGTLVNFIFCTSNRFINLRFRTSLKVPTIYQRCYTAQPLLVLTYLEDEACELWLPVGDEGPFIWENDPVLCSSASNCDGEA